jgi:hypothetical protein
MLFYTKFHFKKLRHRMLASHINQAPACTVGTNKHSHPTPNCGAAAVNRYVSMDIRALILNSFENGLTYNESAQLCLRLFSTLDGIPESVHEQCNKEDLALAFSELAKSNFIVGDTLDSVIYGANHHLVTDKGHWIEVIASIFKIGNAVNHSVGNELISHITKT